MDTRLANLFAVALRMLVVASVAASEACAPVVVRASATSAVTLPSAGGVPAGTPVSVIAVTEVNSARDGAYGPPMFVTAGDVRDPSGNVVIPRGATVAAIVESRRARRIGREGWVVVRLQGVTASDGTWIPLTGTTAIHGVRRVPLAAGLGVGLLPVFGGLSLLFFLIEGRDVALTPDQPIVGEVADVASASPYVVVPAVR